MMVYLVWFFHILNMYHLFFQYMLDIYYSNNEILTDFSASKKTGKSFFMESIHKFGTQQCGSISANKSASATPDKWCLIAKVIINATITSKVILAPS